MSRGHAPRGMAASTAAAKSRVVRSGRRATMNCAIRRAQRSSPYSRRIRSSSLSSNPFTIRAASSVAVVSIRMSRAPSPRKLNPRSGASSWTLERPKSKRITSAGTKPALLHPERDPALAVRLERLRHRIERPRQRSLVGTRQGAAKLLRQRVPQVRRIDRQRAVLAHRDVAPLRQLLAKCRWDGEPSFVVHADPMCPGEHSLGLPELERSALLARTKTTAAAMELHREAQ